MSECFCLPVVIEHGMSMKTAEETATVLLSFWI